MSASNCSYFSLAHHIFGQQMNNILKVWYFLPVLYLRNSLISILIPQEPFIRPLLFLIYINDLTEGVNCRTLIYVDDAKTKSKVKNKKTCRKPSKIIKIVQMAKNMELFS